MTKHTPLVDILEDKQRLHLFVTAGGVASFKQKLAQFHGLGFLHGDLHGDNEVFLVDFGLSLTKIAVENQPEVWQQISKMYDEQTVSSGDERNQLLIQATISV